MHVRLTPMIWFVILSLIAVGLAIGLPPDPHALERLHTSADAYRLAVAALLIPYVLIWYGGFYAFDKLRAYSRPIREAKDGAAFYKMSAGMGVLAFSLVIPTILSLILNSIAAHSPSFKPAAVIINNYSSLFPALAALLLLYSGAHMLLKTTQGKTRELDLRWHAPWFLGFSIAFSYLVIQNYYRGNPYHLNLWLLIATFIVPYLYVWMVGLLSAYELHWYAKTVKGLVYRQAVRRFAHGIAVTILGSVAIQFINVTLAQQINQSLVKVLLMNYVLIVVVAVGLVMMALGAKQLKRIEDI